MNTKILPDKRAFLITGLLIIIICYNTCPIIQGSLTSSRVKEGNKIVVDWTEDDMYRYSTYTVMYWKGFLQSHYNKEQWLNSYEEIQDIDLHLEFDFDKMLVKGYFSGSSESVTRGVESKQVFYGWYLLCDLWSGIQLHDTQTPLYWQDN